MKRVVVTGMGCISALGHDLDAFRQGLLAGRCGIGEIGVFDTTGFDVDIAGEVPDYDPKAHFAKLQLSQLDRFAQFGVLSAREAVRRAGLVIEGPLAERTAVVHGTGIGSQSTQDEVHRSLYAQGAKRVHPLSVPKAMTSAAVSQISMDLGAKGPAFGTVSACSSAGHALAMACMLLQTGQADAAISGGAEAPLSYGAVKAWIELRVMARDTCRPFSARRGGMVLGEGAGTMVLETLEHAERRGAPILAELAGVGMSSDAYKLVKPDVAGMERAMGEALRSAGLEPGAIDYLNAHGTGTAQNDPTETAAIRSVFGAHADRLAVSSTKSMHAHTLGAAAVLEAIASVIAIEAQTAPPTIGYLGPDPGCDLDYVPNEARPTEISAALSNSFAFGGLNCSLVFTRHDG